MCIRDRVNKYMDEYLKDNHNLAAKAKAEKYAKITDASSPSAAS